MKKRVQIQDQATAGLVTVSARPRNPRQGLLRFGALTLVCALGKGGIGIGKIEGDGKTPLATMHVMFGFYRPGRWPMMARSSWLLPVSSSLGWCDAPHDRNYNLAVMRPYPASHEMLARDDGLYDCVIVLNWNLKPRMRNRGSAIFLHIARPGMVPTEGCIAVSKTGMMQLLKVLKPGMRIKTASR